MRKHCFFCIIKTLKQGGRLWNQNYILQHLIIGSMIQMDLFIIKETIISFINISHMIINGEQCIGDMLLQKILSILNIFQLLYIHLKILIEMDVFQDQQLKSMANFIFIIQLLNTLKKIQIMYIINIVMMI